MRKEEYFSVTVKEITAKLTALGGLMMGLDSGAVEMRPDEVNALGMMVHDLGVQLDSWNNEQKWEEQHSFCKSSGCFSSNWSHPTCKRSPGPTPH